LQLVLNAAQRVVVERLLDRPHAADHQQPCRLAAPGDAADQVDGRRIAPLQVFEHQQQRPLPREHLERIGDLAQHAHRHGGNGGVAPSAAGGVGSRAASCETHVGAWRVSVSRSSAVSSSRAKRPSASRTGR
jgi:hypothetical protein